MSGVACGHREIHHVEDAALERIESKLAFLERANQELSDVVYRQQREIDVLRAQVAKCREQLDDFRSDGAPESPAEEKPPHY